MHITTSLLLAAQLVLGMGSEVRSLAEFAPASEKDFGIVMYLKGAPIMGFVEKTKLIDALVDRDIKKKKMSPEQAAMMRMQSAIQLQLITGIAQKITEGIMFLYADPADIAAKAAGKEKLLVLANLALAKEPAREHPMLVGVHNLKEGEIDTATFGSPVTRFGAVVAGSSRADQLTAFINNKKQSSRVGKSAIAALDGAIGSSAVYLSMNNLDAFEGQADLHKLAATDEKQNATLVNGLNKHAGGKKMTTADIDKMIADMKSFEFMTDFKSDTVLMTAVMAGKTPAHGALLKKVSDDDEIWRESYRANGLEDMADRIKHEARLEEKAPGYRLTVAITMASDDFKELILRSAERVTEKAKAKPGDEGAAIQAPASVAKPKTTKPDSKKKKKAPKKKRKIKNL